MDTESKREWDEILGRTSNSEDDEVNMENDQGSFALGFLLSMFFSGIMIWIIALISGKSKTRKGAFWCMFIQFLILVIAIMYSFS